MNAEYVAIHDAARPFVTPQVIWDALEAAYETGAAAPAVPVKDTVKVAADGLVVETPAREKLYAVQTPQCFEFALVKDAYETLMNSGDTSATDDAMVVETYGNIAVRLFEGGYDNIKITTPEDVRIAGSLMKARKVLRALHKVHDKIIYVQMQAYKQQKKIKK